MALMDMTLRDFCGLLASKEPAPGGGSASALAGALAASLGLMSANLTVGKKAFLALDEDQQEALRASQTVLAPLKQRFEELVDEDTEAFNAYMTAVKMPKDTEEAKKSREAALAIAQDRIIQTPLETCKQCLNTLRALTGAAEFGNKNAASDVGVAARLAYAGLEGAVMNVKINLPGLEESERINLLAETDTIITQGKTACEKILEIINRGAK